MHWIACSSETTTFLFCECKLVRTEKCSLKKIEKERKRNERRLKLVVQEKKVNTGAVKMKWTSNNLSNGKSIFYTDSSTSMEKSTTDLKVNRNSFFCLIFFWYKTSFLSIPVSLNMLQCSVDWSLKGEFWQEKK